MLNKIYAADPLWDGTGCALVLQDPPPAHNLEVRICGDGNIGDVLVQLIELYVQ